MKFGAGSLSSEDNMMRVAIVEDDADCVARIKEYIERYCTEHNETVQITTFSDGIDIASDYSADYDVVFLDIVMKHMDGMKAAEIIRKMDNKVIIIFMTGDPQYAVQGYSVEALSYLLKPVNYFVFSREFGRCIAKINGEYRKYISFATERGMDRIALDKIIYIESRDHQQIIYTTEKTYHVYETMKKIEGRLPKGQFSRCNNCYIVNLSYVKGIHGEYVSIEGGELKMSRSRRKPFMEDMATLFINE